MKIVLREVFLLRQEGEAAFHTECVNIPFHRAAAHGKKRTHLDELISTNSSRRTHLDELIAPGIVLAVCTYTRVERSRYL
jgi:hypothetical protein